MKQSSGPGNHTEKSPQEIKIYCSQSKKKTSFRPQVESTVSIYACGPTVYGLTHVGNACAAIAPDLFHRIFKRAGYDVTLIANITDIDDKIIKAAQEAGSSTEEITKKFSDVYLSEIEALANLPVTHRPRATEAIKEISSMIEKLIADGFAYAAETPFGTDVYFRVDRYEEYGKLSKRKTEDLIAGARVEPGEMKENPLDFTLWKAAKEGEPSWDSPWGAGRPGWHIECSAMVHKFYPKGVDIHMGGLDLIFPHHENEIAQTECCTGHPIARYWAHNGLVVLGKEKMSKSIGNIFTTQEFLNSFGPEVLRLLILQHHYRSPIDFSEEVILRTEALVERLYHAKEYCQAHQTVALNEELFAETKKQIDNALYDDFNSAKALGFALKDLRKCFKEDRPEMWKAWGEYALPFLNDVMGIVLRETETAKSDIKEKRFARMGVDAHFADRIEEQLAARENKRAERDFAAADQIRQDLENEGLVIMDGPDGTAWTVSSKIKA